ncbi:MAG: D-tyrosyl-tRNA(Tyr) deacylase [Rhodospirillales bacterium]|jgi:D-aminoacyl-tRNA deacylase|nr:D-tyrosyl-tRNA(Tyr) deacylase [Rhodospirillales bacterium]
MKAVLQRVKRACVTVDGKPMGKIDRGLVVLLCVEQGDNAETAAFFAGKTARMRIFSDDDGKFNLSLLDVGGKALVVSQFTLAGNWRKGNRPSFSSAAQPNIANPLYGEYCKTLENLGVPVETGVFAAHMDVDLVNDGPVTIWMDSDR